MKKSQLRKLIRESIKQLMTEQQLPGTYCVVQKCNQNATFGNYCIPNIYNPALGQSWEVTQTSNQPSWPVGTQFFIKEVTGVLCPAQASGNLQLIPYNSICARGCSNPWDGYPTQHNTAQPTGPCWQACPGQATSWDCKQIGNHPKFGSKCVEIQGTAGQFPTKQDCIFSGCEGLGPGLDGDTSQPCPQTESCAYGFMWDTVTCSCVPDPNPNPDPDAKMAKPAIPIWPSKTVNIEK